MLCFRDFFALGGMRLKVIIGEDLSYHICAGGNFGIGIYSSSTSHGLRRTTCIYSAHPHNQYYSKAEHACHPLR